MKKHAGIRPELTFRRASSLRDRLVSSHYSSAPCSGAIIGGTHRCGKRKFCPWLCQDAPFILSNGELFCPKFRADCNTQGVVYLMSCVCVVFYVGMTDRCFWQCIKDHVYLSTNGKMLTSRHLDLYHGFDATCVSFIALAVIPKDPRGGNWKKVILQKETLWIERLNATNAPGINETQSYRSFL